MEKSNSSFTLCPNCNKIILYGFLSDNKEKCLLCEKKK